VKKYLIFLLFIILQSVPVLAEKNEIVGLIKLLDSNDYRTHVQARQRLENIGSLAVPALIQILKDTKSSDNLRLNTIITLEGIGPEAKVAVPVLLETIEDKSFPIRQASVFALGIIDPTDEKVISALINALHDKNESVSEYALLSLRKCGPKAVPALGKLLKQNDSNLQIKASIALTGNHEYRGKVIPILVKALTHNNIELRNLSAAALAEYGSEIFPQLLETLNNKSNIAANSASNTLLIMYSGGTPPSPSNQLFSILRLLLGKSDKRILINTTALIAKIGPEANPIVPALIKNLGSMDADVRFETFNTLFEIGEIAIPDLIPATSESNINIRINTLALLSEYEPLPESSADALIRATKDNSPLVRKIAMDAISNVRPLNDQIIEALKKGAEDKDESVNSLARKKLIKIRAIEENVSNQ
jgi:HEAT repeat protein